MGDRGYVDEHGYLYIIGRIKETISLRNAKKINSTLIEELIGKCEKVLEVAVKGVENNKGFDDIHAFVNTRYDKFFTRKVLRKNILFFVRDKSVFT